MSEVTSRAQVVAISGAVAGVPEAFVSTPFQVIKVRFQAKENAGRFKGNFDCALTTVRQQGVLGLMTGVSTTIWRNSVWNCIYFFSLHEIRRHLPPTKSHLSQICQTMGASFMGGLIATSVNAPLDTAKSRIQARLPPPGGEGRGAPVSRSTFGVLREIVQKEGLFGCYKGFRPKALRMALGGAVGMAVYEWMLSFLGS